MRTLRWALACLLLLATRAVAAPIYVSGFDANDGSALPSTSVEFTTAGTDVAGALALIEQNGTNSWLTHNANNGGASNSTFAAKVNVASGKSRYFVYTPASALSQIAVGLSMHFGQGGSSDASDWPTVNRQIVNVVSSGTVGCNLQIDANGNLDLYLNHPTDGLGNVQVGTHTAQTLYQRSCVNNVQAACNGTAGQCDSGGCAASCTTTTALSGGTGGTGCYWGGIEVVEVTGAGVQCKLYVDGRLVINGAPTTDPGVGSITEVDVGAPGTEASTMTYFLDDAVFDDGGGAATPRANYGFVDLAVPLTDMTDGFKSGGCSGCSGVYACCVDDYATSPFLYDAKLLNAAQPSVTQAFCAMTPTVAVPAGDTVTAVQGFVVGTSPNTAGTRDYTENVGVCTCGAGACTSTSACKTGAATCHFGPAHAFTVAQNVATTLLDSTVQTTSPDNTGNWSATTVGELAFQIQATSVNNVNTKFGAFGAYVRVAKPDTGKLITLRDHNKGAEDHKVTIATIGDSTAGGTLSSSCSLGSSDAGAPCNQVSYCSWSTTRDQPTGGCGAVSDTQTNALCQTCSGNRAKFNAGAGYPCGPNNLNGLNAASTCNLGTCSAGFCTGDGTVSCTTNADCEDHASGGTMGECDTCVKADCSCTALSDSADCPGGACVSNTACASGFCCSNAGLDTCTLSCPGGTCPTSNTTWGSYLQALVGADQIINCPQGFEPSSISGGGGQRILSGASCGYLPTCGVIDGRNPTCSAIVGTGACTCNADAQCGGGAGGCDLTKGDGSTWGLCKSTTPGGTCQGAVANDCRYCTVSADCGGANVCTSGVCNASTSVCAFNPPDYLVWLEGYNDANGAFGHAPNCTGAQAVFRTRGLQACAVTTVHQSMRNADCATVWPVGTTNDAESFGTYFADNPPTRDCISGANCSIQSQTCTADSQCPCVSGNCQTCVSGTAGTNNSASTFEHTNGPLAGGYCACTADTQCPAGTFCAGFPSAGSIANCKTDGTDTTCTCHDDAVCLGTGVCERNSSIACTTNDDCCGKVSGLAITAGAHTVCAGTCSQPSDATACATDADCPASDAYVFRSDFQPSWTGTCVNGRCTCTGLNRVRPSCQNGACNGSLAACTTDADCATSALCAPQFYQWHGEFAAYTLRNILAVLDRIARLPETTPPLLLPATLPVPNLAESWYGFANEYRVDTSLFIATNAALVDTLTRVVDAETAMHALPEPCTHQGNTSACNAINDVHLNSVGASLVGGAVANALNALNTCAQGTCVPTVANGNRARAGVIVANLGACSAGTCAASPNPACTANADCSGGHCGATADCPSGYVCQFGALANPQRYCQNADTTWSTTQCLTSADCTASQTCAPRPCTAACNVNEDCSHWYGAAYSCSGGKCVKTADSSDACTDVDGKVCVGGSAPGSTCTSTCAGGGVCTAFTTAANGVCTAGSYDPCSAVGTGGANNACNPE